MYCMYVHGMQFIHTSVSVSHFIHTRTQLQYYTLPNSNVFTQNIKHTLKHENEAHELRNKKTQRDALQTKNIITNRTIRDCRKEFKEGLALQEVSF
jgi:hypothetical protein